MHVSSVASWLDVNMPIHNLCYNFNVLLFTLWSCHMVVLCILVDIFCACTDILLQGLVVQQCARYWLQGVYCIDSTPVCLCRAVQSTVTEPSDICSIQ